MRYAIIILFLTLFFIAKPVFATINCEFSNPQDLNPDPHQSDYEYKNLTCDNTEAQGVFNNINMSLISVFYTLLIVVFFIIIFVICAIIFMRY